MKYTIEWCEAKQGTSKATGKAYTMTTMTLKDENGVITDKVTTFDVVQNGAVIEGTIEQNGQYLNFKPATNPNGTRKPNMERVMEKKANMIGEAQATKAQNIAAAQDRSAWMWAKTNASTLLAGSFGKEENNKYIAEAVLDLATKIYNGEPNEPF